MLVNPGEFFRYPKGKRCSNYVKNIIKEFPFPSPQLENEFISLQACEKYCSMKSICWGCSIECNDRQVDCKFNAISSCKDEETWTGLLDGDITVKQGKRFLYGFSL